MLGLLLLDHLTFQIRIAGKHDLHFTKNHLKVLTGDHNGLSIVIDRSAFIWEDNAQDVGEILDGDGTTPVIALCNHADVVGSIRMAHFRLGRGLARHARRTHGDIERGDLLAVLVEHVDSLVPVRIDLRELNEMNSRVLRSDLGG